MKDGVARAERRDRKRQPPMVKHGRNTASVVVAAVRRRASRIARRYR